MYHNRISLISLGVLLCFSVFAQTSVFLMFLVGRLKHICYIICDMCFIIFWKNNHPIIPATFEEDQKKNADAQTDAVCFHEVNKICIFSSDDKLQRQPIVFFFIKQCDGEPAHSIVKGLKKNACFMMSLLCFPASLVTQKNQVSQTTCFEQF